MNILVLIGQRTVSYPGQYTPEALSVIDELGNDDNPDYMKEEYERYKDDFDALKVITISINDGELDEELYPSSKILNASIIK